MPPIGGDGKLLRPTKSTRRKRPPASRTLPSTFRSDAASGGSRKAVRRTRTSVRPQTKTPAAPSRPARSHPSVRPQTKTPARSPRKRRHTLPSTFRSDAASGGRNQMKRANRFKRTPEYHKDLRAARLAARNKAHVDRVLEKYRASKASPEDARRSRVMAGLNGGSSGLTARAGPTVVAGLNAPGSGAIRTVLGIPVQGVKAVGITGAAAYHDPVGVPTKTASQLGKAILASPSAIADAVMHPEREAKRYLKSAKSRQDESFSASVKRVRKEGALEDLSDVAAIVPAGAATGTALKVAARAGMPGVKHIPKPATRARRRISGGTVKARPGRPGLIGNLAGHGVDVTRAKLAHRKVRRADAGKRHVSGLVRQAVEANRTAGRTVEVVPIGHKFAGRRRVAKATSRHHYRQQRDNARTVRPEKKRLDRLNPQEREALYFAQEYGIRTAEQGRRIVTDLRDEIVAARKSGDVKGPKGTSEIKRDMVPVMERILADPEAHFTNKLARTVDEGTPTSRRVAREDPRYDEHATELRRHAPLADYLGVERGVRAPERRKQPRDPAVAPALDRGLLHPGANLAEAVAKIASGDVPKMRYVDEAPDVYLKRVKKAVEHSGLSEPVYFRGGRMGPTVRRGPDGADVARMEQDVSYTGESRRRGVQDIRPEVHIEALMRNVRSKHTDRYVDDLLRENALAKYDRKGAKAQQLEEELRHDSIEPESVRLWNPDVFRDNLRQAGEELSDDLDEASSSPALRTALSASMDGTKHGDTRGWQVMPAHVMDQIEGQQYRASGPGHGVDVLKVASSRLILLTGNIPWLGAQVLQSALGAGAATRGKVLLPSNWYGAWRSWSNLSEAARAEVGSWLALDAPSGQTGRSRRRAKENAKDPVNAYRQLRDWSGWHRGMARGRGPSVSDLNPIEAMARLDRLQNNAARIAVWHALNKSDGVRRVHKSAGSVQGLQARIMATLNRDKGTAAIQPTPELLEQYGDRVNKFLGDFSSMTVAERRFLGRGIMFYPFVRFSTRLLVHTLPVEHPFITGMMSQLGNLEAQELEELYGPEAARLMSGKIHLPGRRAIDLAKLNPLTAAPLTALQENRPAALLGMLPPAVGMLFNQAGDRDYYTGARQMYKGDPGLAYKEGFSELPFLAGERPGALLDDVLSLSAAGRVLKKKRVNPLKGFKRDTRLEGKQGVDSSVLFPRPIKFTGTSLTARLQAAAAKKNEALDRSNSGLLSQLIPFYPQHERDAARAKENERIQSSKIPAAERKNPGLVDLNTEALPPTKSGLVDLNDNAPTPKRKKKPELVDLN